MEEVGVRFTTEDEQAFFNAMDKAKSGITDFDRALAKMAQQQETAKMLENVKLKLAGMTEAEKFTAMEAVRLADETARADKAIDNMGESSRKTHLSLTDIKSGIDMVKDGIEKAGQIIVQTWEKTGGATMEYAAQVRELSRMSGASAENTSRLIQASDDLSVSYDDLKRASKAAADEGISLTVEKMAALQKEYQAIQDPAAKVDFLTKTFGKTGIDLGKILEVDSEKFRQLAASQSKNLILTQQQVDQARKMEIAQDGLGDALQGFAYVIGNAVMPAATDYLNALTDMLTLGEKVNSLAIESADTYEDYKKAVAQNTEEEIRNNAILNKLIAGYPILAPIIRGVSKATLEQSEEQWKANKALAEGSDKARFLSDEYALLAEQGAKKAALAIAQLKYDQDKATTSMFDYAASAEGAAARTASLKAGVDALTKTFQDYLSTSMSIYSTNKDYAKSFWEIQNSIVSLTQGIDTLSKLKYRTPEQEAALAGMREDLNKQKTALQELEDKHTEATKTMIFNMLLQKAASDGLTGVEFENLMKIAKSWGLVDDATYNSAKIFNGIDLNDGNLKLTTLDGLLQNIATSSTGAAGAYAEATDKMNRISLGVIRGELAPIDALLRGQMTNSAIAAQELANAAARMNEIKLGVARGELAPIDALLRSIMGQPNSKTVTITTNHIDNYFSNNGTPGTGTPGYYDPSQDPTVNGLMGDLFNNTVRAIDRAGGQSINSSISNSNQNNYNLQVMTNQSPAVVQQSFEMMRLLA